MMSARILPYPLSNTMIYPLQRWGINSILSSYTRLSYFSYRSHLFSSTTTSTSSTTNYYTILGIPETASTQEIKTAFRKLAKLYHPDIQSSSSTTTSSTSTNTIPPDQFITILIAYEQLNNPRLRAQYNQQLAILRQQQTTIASKRRTSVYNTYSSYYRSNENNHYQTNEQTATSSSSSSSSSKVMYDDTSMDNPNYVFGGYNCIARRAAKYGENSVWQALFEANTGPLFQSYGVQSFPYAFELDERNHMTISNDIIQMCIGTGTFLGSVRGYGLEKLASNESSTTLLPSQQQKDTYSQEVSNTIAGSSTNTNKSNENTVIGTYDRLEFHYQGKLLASAVMYGTPFSVHENNEASIDRDEEIINDYITIYRHYEDGSRGLPLAHILSSQGYGNLKIRRIISCDLVNPYEDIEEYTNSKDKGEEFKLNSNVESFSSPTKTSMSPIPSPTIESQLEDYQQKHKVRKAVMDAVIDEHEQGIWRKKSLNIGKKRHTYIANPFGSVLTNPTPSSSFAVTETHTSNDENNTDTDLPFVSSTDTYHISDTGGGIGTLTRRSPTSKTNHHHTNDEYQHQHTYHQHTSNSTSTQYTSEEEYKLSLWNMSHWWAPSTGFIPLEQFFPDPRKSYNRKDIPTFNTHYSRFRTWNDPEKLYAGISSKTFSPSSKENTEWPFSKAFPPVPCRSKHDHRHHPHDINYLHPKYTTHTLITYQTPGISHIRWIRNLDRYTEAYATRIRLPDSQYWLWEPRSPEHSRGGYNVSINPRRNIEPSLHPVVYILTSAVLTLEKEYTRELKHIKAEQRKEKWSKLFSLWKK